MSERPIIFSGPDVLVSNPWVLVVEFRGATLCGLKK